jgi:hypothetical protein
LRSSALACTVIGASDVSPGRNRSIARSLKAGTVRSTGSLTQIAPADIMIEPRPPKVSGRAESGTIAESFARSATCPPPITSGAVPH